ncbi:hypothetical protein CGX12_11830 [Zobellella denitrificans]|uniref:hypothetical protein n=1 Tax=Zobellella denitrificans TaxID=347534 RepID=UPI000B9CB58D|nr:hypothetical protein [Zobellella denitrificans]OXS14903.1 hypothetical protein CGX12_11830 [Zobellella denitrificans]
MKRSDMEFWLARLANAAQQQAYFLAFARQDLEQAAARRQLGDREGAAAALNSAGNQRRLGIACAADVARIRNLLLENCHD